MKITKQLLKQILKEEINDIVEALPPGATASIQRAQLEKIYKFLEMQMQNKSLGFDDDVTMKVVHQLFELVDSIDTGAAGEGYPIGARTYGVRPPKDGNE